MRGLAFLSKHRIMHRDIKLDNIFVKLKDPNPAASLSEIRDMTIDKFEFKIGDFGLAKHMAE